MRLCDYWVTFTVWQLAENKMWGRWATLLITPAIAKSHHPQTVGAGNTVYSYTASVVWHLVILSIHMYYETFTLLCKMTTEVNISRMRQVSKDV